MVFQAGQRLTAAALNQIVPQILVLAADTPTTSTTPTVLLTATVVAATYYVEGALDCVIGGTATIPKIGFYGSSTASTMRIIYSMVEDSTSGESVYSGNLTAMSTNTAQSATVASAAVVQVRFSGAVTFSGGGTFIAEAGDTVGGNHYTVKAGSYMSVFEQVL